MSEIHEAGYVLGLDLGQSQDFTAVAVLRVLERIDRVRERDRQAIAEAIISGSPHTMRGWVVPRPSRFPQLGEISGETRLLECVHLDRIPLGTSYPRIVEDVRALLGRVPLRGRTRLVCDASGVGAPIVDALEAVGVKPVPIVITAGDRAHRDAGRWTVPKRDIVHAIVLALQTERLKVASELRYAQALADELLGFEQRLTDAGRDTYGARSGVHDDLVLALGIAVWYATRVGTGHGRPESWARLRW